jgi:hypothetical protein
MFLDGSTEGMEKTMKQIIAMQQIKSSRDLGGGQGS